MNYYEVIYETGAHSVVSGESDDEALRGIREQHKRAVNGEDGGPAGHPAERVKAVLKYDRHPADFGSDNTLSEEVAKKQLSELVKGSADDNGVVHMGALASNIRELTDPVDSKSVAKSRHASMFKAKEVEALDPKGWE